MRELWKFMELIMFSMYFTTIIHVCLNGSLVSTCHHLLTCLALSNMAKAWILNCCLGCTWFLVKKDNLKGFFLLQLAHGSSCICPSLGAREPGFEHSEDPLGYSAYFASSFVSHSCGAPLISNAWQFFHG